MNNQMTTIDSKFAKLARDDVLKRRWLKPLIKRQSGTWVCSGRCVTGTGYSPQAAYRSWLLVLGQQSQIIYASVGKPALSR